MPCFTSGTLTGFAVMTLILALCCVPAAAQRSKTVDRALKEQYPDAQTKVVDQQTINGVKVNEVRVQNDYGESTALVTEFGDFLLAGKPLKDGRLPAGLDQGWSGLFRDRPRDVQAYTATFYWVNLASNDRQYRLRLDAAGRIRDIETISTSARGTDARRSDDRHEPQRAEKADSESIRQIVERRYEAPKIDGIYRVEGLEGFYQVDYRTDQGPAKVILNEDGIVYLENEKIDQKDLPRPVAETVERLFQGGKIANVSRGTSDFYEFSQSPGGSDQIVIKMRPNGEIMDVTNQAVEREEEAVTAKARQRGSREGGNRDSDRDRERGSERNRDRRGS